MRNWNLIHSYTRAQAIADGFLVDVSEDAREARFRLPVALTSAVWRACVEWPDSEPAIQDESGRLWDVLYMAHVAARRYPHAQRVDYELYVVPRGKTEPKLTALSLHVGPGDDAAPVLTIMFPDED